MSYYDDEVVKYTKRFTYLGQELIVDVGSEGSVRFRIGDYNVQLTSAQFNSIKQLQPIREEQNKQP